MARAKQIERKTNKGSSGVEQGSKTGKENANVSKKKQKDINCGKMFSRFKFERNQTLERLVPRATITRCCSPFLRTNGCGDVIIGSNLFL